MGGICMYLAQTINKKNMLMGKKNTTLGSFLLGHWLPRILWKGAHGLPKSSSTCHSRGNAWDPSSKFCQLPWWAQGLKHLPSEIQLEPSQFQCISNWKGSFYLSNMNNFGKFGKSQLQLQYTSAVAPLERAAASGSMPVSPQWHEIVQKANWKNANIKNVASEDNWSFKSQRCPVSCRNCWQSDSTIQTVDSQVTVSMILILK